MVAIVCLTSVAVAALALSAFLARQLVLAQRQKDDDLQTYMKEARQERADLVTRIQRPDLIPPSPADRTRAAERQTRDAVSRSALAKVGTVQHTPPAAGGE